MSRPRSVAAHQAALDATAELMLDAGVEGVTLEEVAARSGVAKSTLYRHFSSKEALVVEAARRFVIEHPTPDTGSLAEDLAFLFGRYLPAEEEQRIPDLLPMLIDAANRDPGVRDLVEELLAERRRPVRTVLRLAQLRGEIRADIDLDTALAMVAGPFTYRRMIDRTAITPEFTRQVLDAAIAGLTVAAPARPPATREQHEAHRPQPARR